MVPCESWHFCRPMCRLKKRRLVRYEAYRHQRLAEAEARQKSKGITLATKSKPQPARRGKEVFRGEYKKHVVSVVMEILADWRTSPFENESATIAGMRSALCLKGIAWSDADAQVREIVRYAYKQLGFVRPTYDQGQREYTERDGVCVWCKVEISTEGSAYGRTGRFCSSMCAESMRQHRAGEWHQRTSAMNRAAAAAIAREKLQLLPCQYCGTKFRPLQIDARGRKFCSHYCAGAYRRTLPERQCEQCGTLFYPASARNGQYCSIICAGVARRTLHAVICANPKCGQLFRQKDREHKFCGVACRLAVPVQAVHERVCTWCSKRFLGKHRTSKFCCASCKSSEYQYRSGRKMTNNLSPKLFDYIFRLSGEEFADSLCQTPFLEVA